MSEENLPFSRTFRILEIELWIYELVQMETSTRSFYKTEASADLQKNGDL